MSAPSNEITRELIEAFLKIKRMHWQHKSKQGNNPSEVRVLLCISDEAEPPLNEMKVSGISKRLRVSTPSITQLLNKLEKDGLIERRMDERDRRVVLVKLTSEGKLIAQDARKHFVQVFSDLSEYLGTEDSKELVRLLSNVYTFYNEKNNSGS
ncbi:MarR family winged helix-turn-helix transcriptional regulator [Bacillus massiliigorillae]|uniref:MarR family winged helix-turn-helix transcriptional regulator n=1 Tax=Bacillus massiliigorillae TaxID=1243664 RepID=UPI0003AAFD65|nr:MarR family transcriptional regulator [Bacillus massiliigorillae]